jgi:hypothetical protein
MMYDLDKLCFTIYCSTTASLGCHSARLYGNYFSDWLSFLNPFAFGAQRFSGGRVGIGTVYALYEYCIR